MRRGREHATSNRERRRRRTITVLHPELLQFVQQYPAGLCAFDATPSRAAILVVKGKKEAILTARMNSGIAVYVAPVIFDGAVSIALVTAFFDDHDEPLVVRLPLFVNDEHSERLRRLLLAGEAQIHFFDEHSREMLAYRTSGERLAIAA